MPTSVQTLDRLDDAQSAAVRRLVAGAAARDGRDPLSDQALTQLHAASVTHLLAEDGDTVTGYAQLAGRSLELVGPPDALGALADALRGRDLLVWSHGRSSPVAEVLRARGFTPARELYQLRRPLDAPIQTRAVPDGVDVRPFAVGRDEDAWLAVNAAAFADHPEQGSWTRADLESRERESWFDAAGFLMAWRDAELLGFHWTKVHPGDLGEVYVIGVAPAAQGLGLGTVLLLLGLDSLRTRGCPQAMLYVDGDNTGARELYAKYGFVEHDLDVQWAAGQSIGTVSNT